MTIHEFGQENKECVLFLHASCTGWDFYEESIQRLSEQYHVIVPAMPGHDLTTNEDYTSVEQIAAELEQWLLERGQTHVHGLYGLSMGGSIALRLLADNKIAFDKAVIDAGITPYQLPWLLTRFIAVRDFLMVELGKHSRKLLELAYPPEKYDAEGLDYMQKVMKHMSARTIWRVFDSCNNYSMPKPIPAVPAEMPILVRQSGEGGQGVGHRLCQKEFPGNSICGTPQLGSCRVCPAPSGGVCRADAVIPGGWMSR